MKLFKVLFVLMLFAGIANAEDWSLDITYKVDADLSFKIKTMLASKGLKTKDNTYEQALLDYINNKMIEDTKECIARQEYINTQNSIETTVTRSKITSSIAIKAVEVVK